MRQNSAKIWRRQTDGRAKHGEASQLQILREYLGLPIFFAYLEIAAAAGQYGVFPVGAPPPLRLEHGD